MKSLQKQEGNSQKKAMTNSFKSHFKSIQSLQSDYIFFEI